MGKFELEMLLFELDSMNDNVERIKHKIEIIISYYNDNNNNNNNIKDDFIDTPINNIDEIVIDYDKIKTDNSINNNNSNFDNAIFEEKSVKENLLHEDIKMLYRKIVIMTHPDKIKDVSNKDKYIELYKKAVKAKEDNDKSTIIYIAFELGIYDVFNIDESHFGNIRYVTEKKRLELVQLENNPYWVWYYTKNKDLKKLMEKQINGIQKRNR